MNNQNPVSVYFTTHTSSLANQMVEGVLQRTGLKISEEEKRQAILMYTDLFKFLGESDESAGVSEHLLSWSKQNAQRLAVSEGRLSEIAIRYPPTREVFINLMTNIGSNLGLSLKEHSTIINRFNSLLDVSLNETVLAFEQISEQYRENTERELAELSAPLVLIQDGVAVMPLIGIMDSYRVAHIAEDVVPKIAEQRLGYLIADYSGILDVDEVIAHSLRSMGSALILMGVEVVVSGMRPELAMTVTKSGINMSDIKTFAHVKQALEWINSRSR
ncbi:STAS domain-containing protein [Neobacillus cucumis]|uniref:Anti-anti-sigma factor n=1 Tax=Neobacillus cucumis TaxID=1740721 RepID=A0A2N5H954_9BACI|nr:STAS domain-containing protein [Neobacillus cucumis]PLS02052.1 anti-anti-sigma factor [Neobacillus cucumis]